MGFSAVSEHVQLQLREFIAQRIGLHFPPNRWVDLQRGLAGAMTELGFADLAVGAKSLLSASLTKTQLDVVASHLTIGETYFFREKKTFEILAQKVLPDLLRSRHNGARRLRIWSAGCCTGEEAYSLAILLRQIMPDLADWFVTILATDINLRFLQKAAAGVYSEWSFRQTPIGFKETYFNRTEDGRYAVLPEIKKQVTFAQLNLVQDSFPSLVAETNAMDVILCRNVLMYFSPLQAQNVVSSLRRALVNEGWLVVSPTDASQALLSQFVPVNYPGVILYQKSDSRSRTEQRWTPYQFDQSATILASLFDASPSPAPLPAFPPAKSAPVSSLKEPAQNSQLSPYVIAVSLCERGQYQEAADTLLATLDADASPDPKVTSLLARALANQGNLADALTWCDRWVEVDKLDSSGHYLRAIVLQELGDSGHARRSFQRAIYLDPQFVLAHFALGNLARGDGKIVEANRHFANASRLLRDYQPEDVLAESDGLTAGRLAEIIASLIALGVVPS
jgi:chemotaxis protein methyltransferase CheR